MLFEIFIWTAVSTVQTREAIPLCTIKVKANHVLRTRDDSSSGHTKFASETEDRWFITHQPQAAKTDVRSVAALTLHLSTKKKNHQPNLLKSTQIIDSNHPPTYLISFCHGNAGLTYRSRTSHLVNKILDKRHIQVVFIFLLHNVEHLASWRIPATDSKR